MSATWLNKMSLIRIPPRQKFGPLHGQKCPCGSCGTQHHMLRDPGGVSPTHSLGNRYTDLGPGFGPFSPSWSWSGSPWRTLSQALSYRWESLCGSQGAQRKSCSTSLEEKLSEFGRTGVGKTSSLTLLAAQLSAENSFQLWFLPRRNVSACNAAKEAPFSLAPSRVWVLNCKAGVGKTLGEWQIGLSKGIKGKWVRLTASWVPPRSPPTSHWEHLVLKYPQLLLGHPQHSTHLILSVNLCRSG